MFQAVISVDQRSVLGQHYTSVPNIKKVIDPLFLNDLKEAFEEAKGNEKKLRELLNRISKIKLFDPACGSGNFLIIAYKELRRLEMQIIKELSIVKGHLGLGTLQLGNDLISSIHLNNFYGIELDDFAHEIAKLSLWLAEHQMNVEFFNEFGRTNPTLPLQEAGQIVCGNACRLDWEKVCPKNEEDEIYIMGNPPFLGKSMQSITQKEDMSIVFKEINGYGNLDYVTCWYKKSADFMKNTCFQAAFVSTNSISQGIAVPPLWNFLFSNGIIINFAYSTFQWVNSAKHNAGVYCVIIGISYVERKTKQIFTTASVINTKSINAYLLPSNNVIVESRLKPLSLFPEMQVGSCPADGGHLILTEKDFHNLILNNPECKKFIRPYMGSDELIKGKERFCFWFKDHEKNQFVSIPEIKERLEKVKIFREKSTKLPTRRKSITPYYFTEERYSKKLDAIYTQYTTKDMIKFGMIERIGKNG
jgi:hypothetical protein